jgi:hypothetical protein
MATTWNKINKASGTSWNKITKAVDRRSGSMSGGGNSIGFLLALTYAGTSSSGSQWTKVTKASGTAWTKITKAT